MKDKKIKWGIIGPGSIANNFAELDSYRAALKPGNLTLLGLVTEGGQGMATSNNGRFVGCLKGSKPANRILETRAQKLFEAFSKKQKLYDLYHSFFEQEV